MCTLTWVHSANEEDTSTCGYRLHFNRDESRLRSTALPPKKEIADGRQYIAPIDQDAMGTWILVNDQGFSVCLLNNYINVQNHLGQRSRGLLVKDLAQAKNIDEALALITQDEIEQYAPFDLYLFDLKRVYAIGWNGEKRVDIPNPDNFKSSSGFNTEEVIAMRQHFFSQADKSPEGLRAFHSSHLPNKSGYSVCMHREDARTQSYTEISVSIQRASMDYCDGPPCSGTFYEPVSIELQ